MNASPPPPRRTLASVPAFAARIVCVAMGIGHTFSLFLAPMNTEQ
jgi:hypothetical protein